MNNTAYRTALTPWAVIRWFSPTERTVVARHRSRSDAEGHLVILRRLMPEAEFRVVFDAEQNAIQ
ncbi:hypothetical protein AB0758_49205 [Tolypothrix bouteillei VB521301_2]|uniref:Uncharacterized protein n=1 Tax=Tolypothrix bouteillei VB521301 TaxID=1479485 RepID=A0A0C1R935_9CYAN